MSSEYAAKEKERRRLVILKKLSELGDLSMLEIGFSASPEIIRNMAAAGLVSVTVSIKPRGQELLASLSLKAQRRAYKAKRKPEAQSEAA